MTANLSVAAALGKRDTRVTTLLCEVLTRDDAAEWGQDTTPGSPEMGVGPDRGVACAAQGVTARQNVLCMDFRRGGSTDPDSADRASSGLVRAWSTRGRSWHTLRPPSLCAPSLCVLSLCGAGGHWRARSGTGGHDGGVRYESWVERQIREATERGEFSGLAGAGKPLDLPDGDDPDWWVKRYLAREGLDASATMPPVMQLRAEAASYPQSLADVADEAAVRELLRDYNQRVVADRRRPVVGRAMPLTAPTVDIEAMVSRWRALRDELAAARAPEQLVRGDDVAVDAAPRRRWWQVWRRDLRRRR